MSKSIKALVAISLFTVVTACAQQEEVVVVEPEPIAVEQPMSKY